MLYFSSDVEIERIGRGLLDRSLPKAEWTHAGHFAAAFWVLRRPNMDAARDLPGLIRAYNEATGVHNTDTTGYHETITLASLRALPSSSRLVQRTVSSPPRSTTTTGSGARKPVR